MIWLLSWCLPLQFCSKFDIIRVMDVYETVEDANGGNQQGLGGKVVFGANAYESEVPFYHTKEAFDDISGLSMSKIEKFFVINRPEKTVSQKKIARVLHFQLPLGGM